MRNSFNRVRGVFRLALFFFFTLRIVVELLVLDKLGKLSDDNRQGFKRRWGRGLIRLAGFNITVGGEVPDGGPYLFAGNHRSTLDPALAFHSIEAWPIARLWIKNWPLVGRGSQLTGIIFVDKQDRDSRHTAKERLLEELQNGNSILIYPEGHTHVEPYTKTFHKGSFEQAAKGGFPVIPYVLEYRDVGDYWDHSENFVQHFINHFGKHHHDIHLEIGPVLRSENSWTLLRRSKQWIDETMPKIHERWGNTHYHGLDVPHETPEEKIAGARDK